MIKGGSAWNVQTELLITKKRSSECAFGTFWGIKEAWKWFLYM